MSTHSLCYQLKVDVHSTHRIDLVNKLLEEGYSDFIEGAVDFAKYPDGDPAFDPNIYFTDNGELGPIVFFSEDEVYLKKIKKCLISINLKMGWEVTWSCQLFPDSDWRDSWRESFKPLHFFDKLVIYPPWLDSNLFHEPYKLLLNPGMAFGTGQHETTQLCLSLALENNLLKKSVSVLDVGTGSGILAMAASLFGCDPVLGVDIDVTSVDVAKQNAIDNNISGQIFFSSCRIQDLIYCNEVLPNPPYDLIFANIQFQPLLELLPHLSKFLKTDSYIVFSGLLFQEEESFVSSAQTQGLMRLSCIRQNDWIGLLCKKL